MANAQLAAPPPVRTEEERLEGIVINADIDLRCAERALRERVGFGDTDGSHRLQRLLADACRRYVHQYDERERARAACREGR